MDFRGIKEFIKDTSGYILVIIGVILFVQYVITIQQNIGPSMQPTLEDGNAFLLNKLSYKIGSVKRGDIVVISSEEEKFFVKRIIGLPGEKIEYKDNILYIDGNAYNEKYLSKDVITYDFNMDMIKGTIDGLIPDDMYLVLGDNRTNSKDSREIGLISKKKIIGKTIFRIWPFSKIGFVN